MFCVHPEPSKNQTTGEKAIGRKLRAASAPLVEITAGRRVLRRKGSGSHEKRYFRGPFGSVFSIGRFLLAAVSVLPRPCTRRFPFFQTSASVTQTSNRKKQTFARGLDRGAMGTSGVFLTGLANLRIREARRV